MSRVRVKEPRCKHGVWAGDHCHQCGPTAPDTPAPQTERNLQVENAGLHQAVKYLETQLQAERATRKQAEAALADLIEIAEGAMKEANRDGAEYNVKEDLAEYRALIAKPVPGTSQPPSQLTGGGE